MPSVLLAMMTANLVEINTLQCKFLSIKFYESNTNIWHISSVLENCYCSEILKMLAYVFFIGVLIISLSITTLKW